MSKNKQCTVFVSQSLKYGLLLAVLPCSVWFCSQSVPRSVRKIEMAAGVMRGFGEAEVYQQGGLPDQNI